jgi:hypothetical protein
VVVAERTVSMMVAEGTVSVTVIEGTVSIPEIDQETVSITWLWLRGQCP